MESKRNIKGCNRIVYCTECGRKFSTVAYSKRMTCVAHTNSAVNPKAHRV